MGKAIPYDYRVKIIARIKSGEKAAEVAEDLGYSESGVKKLWYAYKKEGAKAYETNYKNCGRSSLN